MYIMWCWEGLQFYLTGTLWWGSEELGPRLQSDLDVSERQGPRFLSADTERLLTNVCGCFLNSRCLRKQAAKQKIMIISAAQETICLDSCSTCRCWHCLNKYLHIALMYPFSINIYSWVKCRLLQSSTASNNEAIPTQIGQLLCLLLYQASSV